MKVRIKAHWRRYAPGQVTDDLPDGVAKTLIYRHIAEPIEVETVAFKTWDTPPMDRMVKRAKVNRK